MNSTEIRKKAISTIDQHYPKQEWVRLYTDGSAIDAFKNVGGRVFIEWSNGSTTSQALPTGATCSNCKTKAEANISFGIAFSMDSGSLPNKGQ